MRSAGGRTVASSSFASLGVKKRVATEL
jgi:hypothetical protein